MNLNYNAMIVLTEADGHFCHNSELQKRHATASSTAQRCTRRSYAMQLLMAGASGLSALLVVIQPNLETPKQSVPQNTGRGKKN